MIQSARQILSLAKQLMPNGRAFAVPPQQPGTGEILTDEDGEYLTDEEGNYIVSEDWAAGNGGFFERVIKGFCGDGASREGTYERCFDDAHSILDHILPLPNNDKFTDGTVNPADNDCNDYEVLFGLVQWGITGTATPTRLQRMAVIAAKMNYPGTNRPRQAAAYIQERLHDYGFTQLYVYENLSNLTPADILGEPVGDAEYGATEYGEAGYGGGYIDDSIQIIANHINPADDADFSPGIVNYGTFFISGDPITTFATVPALQQTQLRQLVLNLKPAHMAAFTFINYV